MFSQVFALALLCAGAYGQNAMTYTINHDGSSSVGAKIPFIGTDSNVISALGSKSSTGAFSEGLALDNVNGHGLSLTHTKIPDFGTQLTAASKLNLLHNNDHKLDANAFLTRNMPDIPKVDIPNFNTVGAGVDYLFKDKVGASLGMAKTPFLQRTDYSALGKLNLFSSPKASVDLNAGFGKSISPQLNTNWQPQGGLTYIHQVLVIRIL